MSKIIQRSISPRVIVNPPFSSLCWLLRLFQKNNRPGCSRRIAKSGGFQGCGLGSGDPSRAGWDNLIFGIPLLLRVISLPAAGDGFPSPRSSVTRVKRSNGTPKTSIANWMFNSRAEALAKAYEMNLLS
jgi:hypothetical protein